MTSVSFGDKPAGNIAIMALRKTAEFYKKSHPEAVETLMLNTYVDDVLDSVPTMDIATQRMEEIDEILKCGNFQIKEWCTSTYSDKISKNCVRKNVLLDNAEHAGRVLGLGWNRKADAFFYSVKLNFSPKIDDILTGAEITSEGTFSEGALRLTKRMILSQVNSLYDPLGLASPFTVNAKINMKNLWKGEAKELGWDDPIAENVSKEWIRFFEYLFEMRNIEISRCMKPPNASNEGTLITFCDGSDDAYGACSYIRFQLENGTFDSNLVMAKTRVTPVKKITPVRSELMGAVLAKRLAETICKESRYEITKKYFITDSEIVRAMIQKDSYGFNSFTSVLIGKIQSGTDMKDWWWIKGELNIADWLTRGKPPQYLNDEAWSKGPSFLRESVSQWPLQQKNPDIDLPEGIKSYVMLTNVVQNETLADRIKIERFSSYRKLLRVTARVLSMYKKEIVSIKNVGKDPDVEVLKHAEMFWVKEGQKVLLDEMKKPKLKRLGAVIKDDIIYIGSRIAEVNYENKDLPILPKEHPISALYAEMIHREAHLGVSAVCSKIRSHFWILGVRCIVKKIKSRCLMCKRLEKKMEEQKMGQLPEQRLLPTPAFQNTGIDYFGPFPIKGEVNKRTTGKGYGVIFSCLASRAIHIELANDYSTQGFLIVLRRFASIRGYPRFIISDPGSQLVGASLELKRAIRGLSEDELKRFGCEKGLEWKFTPADAPWQNGATEALIKSVKKVLQIVIGEQRLSFAELMTVFYEVANTVNERPIGSIKDDNTSYLCPNQLLLGRSSSRVPSGPFQDAVSCKIRFEFVQKIVNDFWKRWTLYYFPALTCEQKWHTERRNVQVGDLVIFHDSNVLRGQWKTALVEEVYPSSDGLVRKVLLKYKNIDGGKAYHGGKYTLVERPIQKIVVILPVDDKAAIKTPARSVLE